MAIDQTAGLVIVGTFWLCYKIFSEVSKDWPFLRNLGYWICLVLASGGMAYIDIIETGAGSGIIEGLAVGMIWISTTFGVFTLLIHFKYILGFLSKIFDYISWLFTGKKKRME